nr:CopG family transcriptional regulator [Candidatus Sigynarchaeota archaeon]
MKSKRVQVTFNDEQWNIILKMKGVLGESDADIVRNIVLAWLAEKSFISEAGKKK